MNRIMFSVALAAVFVTGLAFGALVTGTPAKAAGRAVEQEVVCQSYHSSLQSFLSSHVNARLDWHIVAFGAGFQNSGYGSHAHLEAREYCAVLERSR